MPEMMGLETGSAMADLLQGGAGWLRQDLPLVGNGRHKACQRGGPSVDQGRPVTSPRFRHAQVGQYPSLLPPPMMAQVLLHRHWAGTDNVHGVVLEHVGGDQRVRANEDARSTHCLC